MLFLSIINDSSAACNTGEMVCGDNCCATLDDKGILTISGSGEMYDYSLKTLNGVYGPYHGDMLNPFYKITSIKEVRFAEGSNITRIGDRAFYINTSNKHVTLPDSITEIGEYAFYQNSLETIIIPDTAEIGYGIFGSNNGFDKLQIICKGSKESCEAMNNEFKNYETYLSTGTERFDLSSNVEMAKDEQCNSAKYYYTGSECLKRPTNASDIVCDYDYTGYLKLGNRCVSPTVGCGSEYLMKGAECISASSGCGENYKADDGICYRVRYTPAEAAEAAGETNTIFLYYR